jgi:hypothetical protein
MCYPLSGWPLGVRDCGVREPCSRLHGASMAGALHKRVPAVQAMAYCSRPLMSWSPLPRVICMIRYAIRAA